MKMNRKLISLVLVLALVMMASVALAAVPSKTTADLVKTGAIVSESGAVLPSDFTVSVAAESIAANTELAKILAFVTAKNEPVANYFNDDVKAEIIKLLPAGTDLSKLVMNEFFPIDAIKYDASYGNIAVTFQCATVYKDGQNIVALLGIVNDSDASVTWMPLQAEVVNGNVVIHFTQEALLAMANGNAMIAILDAE